MATPGPVPRHHHRHLPDPNLHARARARQDLTPLFVTGAEIDRERHHVQPSYPGVR